MTKILDNVWLIADGRKFGNGFTDIMNISPAIPFTSL